MDHKLFITYDNKNCGELVRDIMNLPNGKQISSQIETIEFNEYVLRNGRPGWLQGVPTLLIESQGKVLIGSSILNYLKQVKELETPLFAPMMQPPAAQVPLATPRPYYNSIPQVPASGYVPAPPMQGLRNTTAAVAPQTVQSSGPFPSFQNDQRYQQIQQILELQKNPTATTTAPPPPQNSQPNTKTNVMKENPFFSSPSDSTKGMQYCNFGKRSFAVPLNDSEYDMGIRSSNNFAPYKVSDTKTQAPTAPVPTASAPAVYVPPAQQSQMYQPHPQQLMYQPQQTFPHMYDYKN